MTCTTCQSEVPVGHQFCTGCGSPVRATCPTCHEPTIEGAPFCTKCGTRLAEAIPSDAAVDDATVQRPSWLIESPESSTPGGIPCTSCGSLMSTHQETCSNCGFGQTSAPSRSTPLFEDAETKRLPIWVVGGVVLAVFALVGLGAAWFFNVDRPAQDELAGAVDDRTIDTTARQTSADGSDEPAVEDPLTAESAESCDVLVTEMTRELEGWASTVTLNQSSRLEVQPLAVPDLAGCEIPSEDIAAQVSLAAPADVQRVVKHSVLIALSSGESPSNVLVAASELPARTYYIPLGTDALNVPAWIVIFASMEQSQHTDSDAQSKYGEFQNLFNTGGVLSSGDYSSLNEGYWVVYGGPHRSADDANAACSAVRSDDVFCYHRYLQNFTNQSAVLGGCGEYGRRTALTRSDVLLGPSPNQDLLFQVAPGAQLHPVGYVEQIDGVAWLPVEGDGQVGWVRAGSVELDAACAGSPTISPNDSCDAVADDFSSELIKVIDGQGDEPLLRFIGTRAARLKCDFGTLQGTIATRLRSEADQTADPFDALVLEVYATFYPFHHHE